MRSYWTRIGRTVALLAATLALFALAGCSTTPQDVLSPFSPAATQIADLFYFVFWIAVVIFILVEGVLIYFVIRYQRRAQDETPDQYHGNTKLEVTWTLIPALILVVVFAFTIKTMSETGGTRAPAKGIAARVAGHQWWWEIQYPDSKVITASELHIPTGQVVNIELASDNVIHSFWVPALMGKTDTVPGHANETWLLTNIPGTYDGQCAEFCGTQHAHMLFRVIAQSPADFAVWIKQQQVVPDPPRPGSPEARGQEIFLTPQNLCIGCHTIAGTNAAGVTGPNLTHVASRSCIEGCMNPNTDPQLHAWLRDPQAVKPGTLMKVPALSEDEITALIAYLDSLK